MYTEQLSQGLAIAAKIDPQTQSQSATLNTGAGINMALFRRAMLVLSLGTNNGSITVQPKSASASGGSFAQIATNVTTAVTASNKVITVEVRADQMPAGQPWLRFDVIEGGVGTCVVSAVVLGGEAVQKPASAQDLAGAVSQRLIASVP